MSDTAPLQNNTDPLNPNLEHIIGVHHDLTAEGSFRLGFWLQSLGEFDQAKVCYEKTIHDAPNYFQAHFNLGVIAYQRAEHVKAIDCFLKAITITPDLAEAWSAIGIIRCDQSRFEEGLVCLNQALAVDPDLTVAHYHMGVALQKEGLYQEGLQSFQKALARDPGFAPARWLSMLSLPILYECEAQIGQYRRQFTDNLKNLVNSVQLETPEQQRYAMIGIRTTTNFYLQYQAQNDLDLQSQYGNFVHRVMAANYPQWVQPRPMPPLEPASKIRIGYVSSFMFAHTVGVFLSGWVENHDHAAFEIHCYHMGHKMDGLTQHLKNHCHAFHCFSNRVEEAARQIEADQLHILIYTDIGMHTETMELAALRLAPVQCKGWGHPVTTGLPTMDFYLSSDLMEPPDGQQYYSETMIRLPHLALCYRPRQLPKVPKTRQQLGIGEDRFVYLSTQSLFKYLPQHDDIYPRIALQVPNASFVFIANQSRRVTQQFQQRLKGAFERYGLDADHFCHMSPRLTGNDFMSLNLTADVLLDTLEWSGGKTTLEAIDCGLPVVACPGRFMRARHAFAMLKMMELTETIGKDKTAYCRIAVELANRPHFYASVKNKLHKNRHKLYGDKVFMDGLERFYRSIVQQKLIDENDQNDKTIGT